MLFAAVRFLLFLPILLMPASAMAAAATAPGPFTAPVKDCNPCRFSPGKGQPDFNLVFVFQGDADGKTLTALDVTPAGGGGSQRLDTGGIAVSDFPLGFVLAAGDFTSGGNPHLGIATSADAGGNAESKDWLYQPDTRRFVLLQRDPQHGDECGLLSGLSCFSQCCGGQDWENIRYRIAGDRTLVTYEEQQHDAGPLLVDTTRDYSVTPPRVKRTTVGFLGDSPERRGFLRQLDAAWRRATGLYHRGDKVAAADAMDPLLRDKVLWYLPSVVPVTTDAADLRLVGQLNDYGFFLAEAGRPKQAIDVLQAVTTLDARRAVAWLNLADAQYAAGNTAAAITSYTEYQHRMAAAGESARVPPRVAERMH